MNTDRVSHATFCIEKIYPHAPEKVFSAFSDINKKRKWFADGVDVEVHKYETDFRILGRECIEFTHKFDHAAGPDKYRTGRNDGIYMDIVENRRIVLAYSMTFGDAPMSSSLATTEFLSAAEGTRLVFTEQAAFFGEADGPSMRQEGTEWLLGKLGQALDEMYK